MAKLRGIHLSREQRLEEVKSYANEMYKIRIQKALKELEKKKYGVPPYDIDSSRIDKKTEVVKWSDVEKCFGEVK